MERYVEIRHIFVMFRQSSHTDMYFLCGLFLIAVVVNLSCV